ncbi:hypothetical protein C5Y96_11905 [Blastopirellula marina]|uniref:Uncharacterized protein n=1 Tax=Blastopirellula marina TaxID=124 RepID=A0A2S8FFY2_9BACT|nr:MULTISPECIES: hypothetical protein [Pirellulaceae]PQO31057.1 hypothetical protein C5Y96_11905 [Blastopirellula marina]RCS51451.1 hypothetical protein DTL36_11915 [Bremerella cremea]
MGLEYFAKLDQPLDPRQNAVLFDLLAQRFGLIRLSQSDCELRLQTPDRANDSWEAVRIAVKPQEVYVCFSGWNGHEYPRLLEFISQWMAEAGFTCHFQEE